MLPSDFSPQLSACPNLCHFKKSIQSYRVRISLLISKTALEMFESGHSGFICLCCFQFQLKILWASHRWVPLKLPTITRISLGHTRVTALDSQCLTFFCVLHTVLNDRVLFKVNINDPYIFICVPLNIMNNSLLAESLCNILSRAITV